MLTKWSRLECLRTKDDKNKRPRLADTQQRSRKFSRQKITESM